MRERRQVQVFSVVAAVAVIAVACLGVAVALRREFDRSAMIEAAEKSGAPPAPPADGGEKEGSPTELGEQPADEPRRSRNR